MIKSSTTSNSYRSPANFAAGVARSQRTENESAAAWINDLDSSNYINSQQSIVDACISLRSLIERHKLKLPRVQYLMRKNIKLHNKKIDNLRELIHNKEDYVMDEEKDYKHDTPNTINNEPNKSDNIGEEAYHDMYQRYAMMSNASTSMGMSQPYGYGGYTLFPFHSYPYSCYDFGHGFIPPYPNDVQMNDMYGGYLPNNYYDQMQSQMNSVDQGSNNMMYSH